MTTITRRSLVTAGRPTQATPPTEDLNTAVRAASLEVLAVNTYQAALDAATAGNLGEIPAAVAEFVATVSSHHQAALDAWNGVITGAGWPPVTLAPRELEAAVNEQFAAVTDVGGAAQLALSLEQTAAATYLAAIGTLQSEAAIALAGSIQPIDRQHISVLLFVLGQYPVPETFADTSQAFTGAVAPPGTMPATR